MKKRILAFGNPVYDVIMTPAIVRRDRVLSGCSTNACLAVSKLGEQGVLVGTVGPDFKDILSQDLTSRGIQHNLIPSRQTGGFSLIYDARGDRELTILGVADPIPDTADGFNQVDFVLLGPILGEINASLVKFLRTETSAPILLDPQGLLRSLRGDDIVHDLNQAFIDIAGMSTIIKANELETRVVTGIDPRKDPEGAVCALYGYGCKIAITTLAEAGSIIYDGTRHFYIPPYEVNAIDPTGAGDTYAAGFMVKYLETPHDLTAVGCFASAVSSVMVENSGPDFPLTRAEANRRQEKLLSGPLTIKL
jgi:sugar/nucleoside kinase (ribokinase family)